MENLKSREQYLGNPNLKKAFTTSEFTEEQIVELQKCIESPKYFILNFINIVTIDKGLVPFKMYKFQEKMVDTFHNNRFTICKLPRQSGKSTIIIAYLLHYVLFNENKNVAILANKSSTARDLLGRLQLAYEHLPKWMQQGVMNWNKGSLELENGSKIVAAATSSSAIRGGSFNIILKVLPRTALEEVLAATILLPFSSSSEPLFQLRTPCCIHLGRCS